MDIRLRTRILAATAALVVVAAPARAQQAVGASVSYLGYSFQDGLGPTGASLLMVPVSVRLPVGDAFTLDVYSAWAQGKVEQSNLVYTLSGVVDTRVKASLQPSPWALLSVGMNLPTGNATHTSQEALVTAVLNTNLLGFSESTWGTGFQLTSSVATAMRAGAFGLGIAAAYSVNGKYDPTSELDLTYQPGNEVRVRVGLDRNFGNRTLTMGGTFMKYAQDQANGRNLFQAGNRLRFDATYAFRSGPGVWTLYAADVWRQHGDLTLSIIDNLGSQVGDSTLATPSQNLLVAGMIGAVPVGGYQFRPMVDVRLQSRKAESGSLAGSGWLVGAGGDFPLRLFNSFDFFPKARVLYGSIKDLSEVGRSVLGGEFSGTIRVGF